MERRALIFLMMCAILLMGFVKKPGSGYSKKVDDKLRLHKSLR